MTWIRIGEPPRAAATWALFAALVAAGCGDSTAAGGGGQSAGGGGHGQGGQPNGGNGGEGATGGENPTGGGGSGGGTTVCTLDAEIQSVAAGARPFDATPSPDGCKIYYAGYDFVADTAMVESIGSDGAGVDNLHSGAPLVAPFGIATSTDGATLFISDPAADEAGADRGAIYSMSSAGGTPAVVSGSEGLSPRSLEVFSENGNDMIYFTGRNAAGAGAVFKLSADGGAPDELTSNGLLDPSGIAVNTKGDAYFVDTIGTASGLARIKVLTNGSSTAEDVVANLHVGYPAGIAISEDDSLLYVSAVDAAYLKTTILIIDLGSGDVTSYTGTTDVPLGELEEPAGIHRAKDTAIMSFVNSKAGAAGGSVFALVK